MRAGWIRPSSTSFSSVMRAASRRTGSKHDSTTASGVSSMMRFTPVVDSKARMLRPSRPMMRPFMSSLGSANTLTVDSAVCSDATRWIAIVTILRARSSPSSRARCSISRTWPWRPASPRRRPAPSAGRGPRSTSCRRSSRAGRGAVRWPSPAASARSVSRSSRSVEVAFAGVGPLDLGLQVRLGLGHAALLPGDLVAAARMSSSRLAAHATRSPPWPRRGPLGCAVGLSLGLEQHRLGAGLDALRVRGRDRTCDTGIRPRRRARARRGPRVQGPWLSSTNLVRRRLREGPSGPRSFGRRCARGFGCAARAGASRARPWSSSRSGSGSRARSQVDSLNVGFGSVPLVFTMLRPHRTRDKVPSGLSPVRRSRAQPAPPRGRPRARIRAGRAATET